jgi:hypothetical protein
MKISDYIAIGTLVVLRRCCMNAAKRQIADMIAEALDVSKAPNQVTGKSLKLRIKIADKVKLPIK